MITTTIQAIEKVKHEFLVLHVRYLGVHHLFVDDGAPPTETLAQLKPRVLDYFRLSETGGKTYSFSHDGKGLTNLSTTLGDVSEGKHELTLKLVEQFEQG